MKSQYWAAADTSLVKWGLRFHAWVYPIPLWICSAQRQMYQYLWESINYFTERIKSVVIFPLKYLSVNSNSSKALKIESLKKSRSCIFSLLSSNWLLVTLSTLSKLSHCHTVTLSRCHAVNFTFWPRGSASARGPTSGSYCSYHFFQNRIVWRNN